MSIDVSVIIVNLNGCALLDTCLASIYRHARGIRFEIIVVDNHSIDDSVAMAKERYPQVRLIENSENKRYAIANNQGLDLAQGRYVLYLNADTQLFSNAIKTLADFLDATAEAGGVGCSLVNADGSHQDSCFRFPSAVNLFYLNTFSRFYWQTSLAANYCFRNETTPQRVDFLVGACYMARRAILHQCGGMDENFYLYGEDLDLCYRVRQGGWFNYYAPSAGTILHHGGVASIDFFDRNQCRRNLQGWKARFQFVCKHYPVWRKAAITLAMLTSFGINALLYGLAGLKRWSWQYIQTHIDTHWDIVRHIGIIWSKES